MCFFSAPKVKKPPPPPSKLDTQADALANEQRRRAGGLTRQETVNTDLLGAPFRARQGFRMKPTMGGV